MNQTNSFRATSASYIATIAIGHGLKHWYIAAFAVFLPLIVEEYEITAAGLTVIGLIRQFAGGFPNFFVGYASDRLRNHWHLMLPASFFFAALFMMLSGSTPWLWPVIVFASLAGVAASFWHPPAISMLSTRFPNRRGMAIAFHGSGSGAGEALGPLVVGFILVTWLADDWRMYTLISFVPAILITILIYWLLVGAQAPKPEIPNRSTKLSDTIGLLKYPVYTSLAYANFTRSFSHFGLLNFMPVYLAQDLGMDSFGVGLHVSLLTLLGVGLGPILGYFSDRIGRRIPIVAAMGVIGSSMILIGLTGDGIILTVSLASAGLFLWSSQDVINATAMDAAPDGLQGSTVGLMFLSSLLGASVGVVVMGLVVDLTDSLKSIFWLAGAVATPGMLIFMFAPLRRNS
ncbi:MAG: MFS transporter [SAR202 cluster bacterium]|nr:MFS transporter [SAR202 cluster bacterium]|tara:strand:- start:144 stop:1349 length:1206 start_codon:yes stop_codon:yes gene_type:complete